MVLYYDWFLTLGDEIQFLKHKQLNIATILFLVIRYGFILSNTLKVVLNIRFAPTAGLAMTDSRYVAR